LAYASSFDQIGIFSKNIEDLSIVLSVIAGQDEFDSTCSDAPVPDYVAELNTDHKYRLAYFPQSLDHPSLDPEIRKSIIDWMEMLKQAGHTIEPVDFNYLDHIVPAYYILTTAEASSNLSRYDGIKFGYRTSSPTHNLNDLYKKTRSEGFGKEVKRRIMQQVRRLIADKTNEVFAAYDLILMPTTPSTAFRFGEKSNDAVEMFLGDLYTVYANLAGIAGISLPLFKHSNGMPFGVQVMSDRLQENKLLDFSSRAMKA
jgi:aspartyl-tRNA(Asn)/glutamyl-tRNA(Gln) amidotransferase subunit A